MKHLHITGDDFGCSSRVNEEIERLHEAGLLTQASLMVNESAVEEAVRIARRHPRLSVGLHLTLVDGQASQVSPLTDGAGRFPSTPFAAGLRCAAERDAVTGEIARQFERFRELGSAPTYFDGHTHLHLHPVVIRISAPIAARHGIGAIRLVREKHTWHPRAAILRILSHLALPRISPFGYRFTDRTFGVTRTGRIDTSYVKQLLATLPDGRSELYFHPGAETRPLDTEPLLEMIRRRGIALAAF